MRRTKEGLNGVQIRRCTVDIPFLVSTPPSPLSHPHLQSSQPRPIGSIKPATARKKTRLLPGKRELLLSEDPDCHFSSLLSSLAGFQDSDSYTDLTLQVVKKQLYCSTC